MTSFTGRPAAARPQEADGLDAEAINDRLAREHSIDDYYARSPLVIRLVERRRLSIIRSWIEPSAGRDVLEVGVGGGHVLEMFPRAKLTGLDVSSVFLASARKRLAGFRVELVHGPLDGLADTKTFDRIICTEVLEHTQEPERMLSEMARRLRVGGVAVITVPNDPLILRAKALVRRSPLGPILGDRVEWGGDAYHLHRWTPAEFEALLSRHFRVTAYRAAPSRALPVRACYRCEGLAASTSRP